MQEHHKKLIKRNTIADFYAGRSPSEGPGVPPSDGTGACSSFLFHPAFRSGGGGAGFVGGEEGGGSLVVFTYSPSIL